MKKMYSVLVMLVLFSFLLSGCYYFAAQKEIKNAENSVAQLKAAGGDKTAPYEYCSAEAFLAGAKKEFNEMISNLPKNWLADPGPLRKRVWLRNSNSLKGGE